MVLSVVVVGILRGVLDGIATKDIVIMLGSGIVGAMVPRGIRAASRAGDAPTGDYPATPSGGQPKSAP
jgi:hypothetical protein